MMRYCLFDLSERMPKKTIPHHIGFIPDGNRRWAVKQGLTKECGYAFGIRPGILLVEECKKLGINEISIFCFTQDNLKRPSAQKIAFRDATLAFAGEIMRTGAAILVVGDETSGQFPEALKDFRKRKGSGIKINLLINYGWEWDLRGLENGGIYSKDVSRIDLIVRWGGTSRLSGFLPVQSVYADFYVRKELWPDFDLSHFKDALTWYKKQDRSFGG